MVKTKMTPRKSDSKGKLPPLARPRRSKEGWGTATETFYKHFQPRLDPVRGSVSYKSMSNMSNRID